MSFDLQGLFYLVNIEFINCCVEASVEIVEKVDDLHGGAASGQRGEAHDVAEVNGGGSEGLGDDGLAGN